MPKAFAAKPTYAQSLDTALTAMEQGKHDQASAPLLSALQTERNEPCGLLALGTLYLHGGSPVRAARIFRRARLLAPNEPLAVWGETLCGLIGASPSLDGAAERVNALFGEGAGLNDAASPAPNAPVLAAYLRLVNRTDKTAFAEVGPDEADPFKLETASFAALRRGDKEKGEALLRALLSRPGQSTLAEPRALIAPFLPEAPLQSGVPSLPAALPLPEPAANAIPFSERVALTPPDTVPSGTAMVTYTVEGGGGGYTSSINYAPFVADWNTERFPNGDYTLRTAAMTENGRVLQVWTKAIRVSNANAPLPSALTPTERSAIRARLLFLLTPRPSRKAAHFALAELATGRNEMETAVTEMEATAAIDPTYRGAMDSLRRFNSETFGKRAGVWKGNTNEKIVALTFDDGPNPVKTTPLMDILKAAQVPSTFFVVGIRAEQSPELLKRMIADGHEIANHSYSHPNLTYLDAVGVERELCRTSAIVHAATGKRPAFYRPPGGNYNTAVVDAAEALGMAGAYWTIDGVKYEQPPFTSAVLTNFVLKQLRPGAIILLHNAFDNTIAAMPAIIAGLRARGYQMVTMSELVKRSQPGTLVPIIAQPGVKTGKKE